MYTVNKLELVHLPQGQILCISPNGLQAGHCDAPPPPHSGWPKIYFRSHFSPFHINMQLFFFEILLTKWLLATIFDDRKCTFDRISRYIHIQYATFISFLFTERWALLAAILVYWLENHFRYAFLAIYRSNMTTLISFCSQNGCRRPCLDDRKSLSIAFLAISDQYTTLFKK